MDSPSPASYVPSLTSVRPRPSSAVSAQFRSTAERPLLLLTTAVRPLDSSAEPRGSSSAPVLLHSRVHRPFAAAPLPVPSAAFHPQEVAADRWGRSTAATAAVALTPSPLSYDTAAAVAAVAHSAPAHSFACPSPSLADPSGRPALWKGEAPAGKRREAQASISPLQHQVQPLAAGGLTKREEDGLGCRSFHFNHRQLWL